MINTFLKILAASAALIPEFIDWWRNRQNEQKQIEKQNYSDSVYDDPVDEWMRGFNGKAGDRAADKAGKTDPHDPERK